jgi:hypothetical protein
MRKPRLLIPLVQHFSVRYLVRTGLLSQLAGSATPIILLNWEDPGLEGEMRQLGAEVYPLAAFRFGSLFDRLRSRLAVSDRLAMRSPSTLIDERRRFALMEPRDRYWRWLWDRYLRTQARFPGAPGRLRKAYEDAFWTDTNVKEIERDLKCLKPDAVFSITPIRIEEEPVLRLAKQWQLPCCAAILSFDNLTTRARLPIVFDTYLLWNRHNSNEVKRLYPGASESRIEITGPPQFDFYWDSSYLWDEPRWRAEVGLPPSRPVIFFGGGAYGVVPQEPQYLEQLDDSIEQGDIRGKPLILFRRHPNDALDRWKPVLCKAKHVVVDAPWKADEAGGNIDIKRYDIERLASTLYHSSVHLNASSTLTVDGAIFDKPQIGPAYDDTPGKPFDRIARDLYLREHYLPITRSGGLDLARNRGEAIAAVNAGFEQPGRLAKGRQKLVEEICTFGDGKSTLRVANSLNHFLGQCA